MMQQLQSQPDPVPNWGCLCTLKNAVLSAAVTRPGLGSWLAAFGKAALSPAQDLWQYRLQKDFFPP